MNELYDEVGIPLPGDQPPQLHPHLLHLHQLMDTISQAVTGMVTHLWSQPAPSAPAASLPLPTPALYFHHRHAMLLECSVSSAQKVSLVIQCVTGLAYDLAIAVWKRDR